MLAAAAKPFVKRPLLFPPALGTGAERNGMSMPKHDLSSSNFQRKISQFCEIRIAPITSKKVLENVRPYLISLVIYRKSPPRLNGRIDWARLGQACGIEDELTPELKKQLRLGLAAIIRWLGAPPIAEDVRTTRRAARSGKSEVTAPSTRKPQRAAADGAPGRAY